MARRPRRQPGDDEPVAPASDVTVLTAVRACAKEAEDAMRTRLDKNRINWDAFHGRQDYSYKIAGQSREFLPKVPMAAEQITAFIKRALTDFGEWFALELPRESPVTAEQLRAYLKRHLETLSRVEEAWLDFPTLLADAVKAGLLGSLVVFKIHGRFATRRRFVAERGTKMVEVMFHGQPFQQPVRTSTLSQREVRAWSLQIDLVRPEDYLKDPTGRGLYRIHRCERDLQEVVDLSEGPEPIYDPAVVALIEEDVADHEREWDRVRAMNQDRAEAPGFRKRVQIDEFWGTLLDARGRAVQTNVVCAVANDRYLIRRPEPNPFWHGQSPFVDAPLVRVPWSTYHRALMDHAVGLNLALNELFNLMLDGGLAKVWGIKQLKVDALEDPRQVSNGIPQGMTLLIKENFPANEEVLKRVDSGEVPAEALTMFTMTDKEFEAATAMPEIRLGQLPAKDVKATEVVEASQNSAAFFDGMVKDFEQTCVTPTLWKALLTVMQHADDLDSEGVVEAMGPRAALALARMTPAERFALFANGAKVKVFGLSAILTRVRDFQKFAAMQQLVSTNPLLMRAWIQRFSADKALTHLLRALNLNPTNFEKDEEELAGTGGELKDIAMLSQMVGAGGRRGMPAEESGGSAATPAEVNQAANPLTGMR